MSPIPAIWFPTVRTGTGTDVFTERLVAGLRQRGLRAEITWLPLRAEYAPWTVPVPEPPDWATAAHVNTWLHTRFLPHRLPVAATIHHAVHHPDTNNYRGTARAIYHRHWIAPNERRVLLRANKVAAVSQFVADSTRQTLVDVPMEVIHNGIDTAIFSPSFAGNQSGDSFRLLYVGTWMPRKGVDLLPRIMRSLGENFELYYTGGPAAEKDKPYMPSNMHDIGRLNGDYAVVAALRTADALLFPSRSEGHPLVVIEAMASGLPIVGMQGSSVAEAVTHGRTGLMCPQEDIAAFADAVRELAADRPRRMAMGRAARDDAVARFSDATMLDAYLRLYSQLPRLSKGGI